MKKLISVYLAAGVVSVCASEVQTSANMRMALIQDYKMMFDRIGQKRIGADETAIESVRPPFIRLSKEEQKKIIVKKDGTKVAVKTEYELQAIMNNRAKISGIWYKLGDKVEDFTLASIQNDGVFLQNNEYKKRLTLRKKNEKISIK